MRNAAAAREVVRAVFIVAVTPSRFLGLSM